MKHLVTRELFAYWDGLRGSRAAPERSDIDPAAIRAILADTVLLEVGEKTVGGERSAIVRLSGTRLNALWCGDIQGRSLSSLWSPDDRAALRDLVDLVLDDQVPVVAGLTAQVPHEIPHEFEMLLLPLRHHGKTHVRLLGSIVPRERPPWLGLQAVAGLRRTSFRSIVPLARPSWRSGAVRAALSTPVRHGRFTVYQGGRATGEAKASINRADRL